MRATPSGGPFIVKGASLSLQTAVSLAEIRVLKQFDAGAHLALSLYLDLGSAAERAGVRERVLSKLAMGTASGVEEHSALLVAGPGISPAQRQELEEDLDMVQLYARTSAGSRSPFVAIFSCAPQFFWRVYHLDMPVVDAAYVGRRFQVEPLEKMLSAAGMQLEEEGFAAPMGIC